MPAQRQIRDDEPSPISQGVQIWGEGPEIVPYATDFVPPAWFTDVSVSGGNGGAASSGSVAGTDWVAVNAASQTPDTYDLEWVAGDTAVFQFFFDGVCWTHDEPADSLSLTWAMTDWAAEVRASAWMFWGYWWPPLWPGYRYIMAFTATSEFVADYNNMGPGTLVTLTGGTIWPGSFVWDLQTMTYPNPNDTTAYTVRTWLTGKATVDPQVTQQDKYPPSNWPVYTVA